MRAKSIRWVAAVAVVSAAPSHSTAAPGGADRPDGPDFIAVVGALGLGPLRSLARRGSTMLGAVLDQDGRLADALDDLTSGETSGFQMSGVAGDAPPIAWEPEDYRRPLRAPADFRLRAQAIRRDGARSVNGAFKTVVTASPAATREFVERLVESFHSGDEALLAAFRRDFPGLARVAGRVVDLDAVRVAEPGESYDVLKMRFPFDRKAMSKHYPTLGALIRFLRVATTTVTDEEGRVAFVTHLDNGDGSFEIKAFSSGRDLLWSDGRRPLRGMGGALMPIEFDPAGQARYQAHVDAEATLLKVAGVSLASFRLPHSRWDLRYEGGEGGRRAAWSLRLVELEEPNAVLAFLLPLEQIHEMLKRSFFFNLTTKPSTEAPPGAEGDLYELGVDFGVELPRLALLDLIQDVTRWIARSRAVTDALRLLRDVADGSAADLDAALARES